MTRIAFLPVETVANKLELVFATVERVFQSGQSLLITVDSGAAADFVDQLLWKQVAHSFLPHIYSDTPTDAKILITQSKSNLNRAAVQLNLTSDPSPLVGQVETVLELDDLTSDTKRAASHEKRAAYLAAGLSIEEPTD